MRYYLILMVFGFFSVYAWKNWYRSLCFLIFAMAIVERPDMPKQMLGIPGLNPWNALFLNVLAAAIIHLSKEKNRPKLTKQYHFFLIYYFIFVIFAYLREANDLEGIIQFALLQGVKPMSGKEIFIEDIVNTLKYAVPGILLFYGCNSYDRYKFALYSILAMNLLLALQIIKVMPLSALTDGHTLEQTAIRKIDRDIGYFRSDLAIFLGGAAWAIYCAQDLFKKRLVKLACIGACFLTILAVALTGGRIGMGGCVAVGLFFAVFRWRKLLILGPLAFVVVVSIVPSVQERVTQGFVETPQDKHENTSGEGPNLNSVTSGRSVIWPHVIDKIFEEPSIGLGRRAMQRSGVSTRLAVELNETFSHPHNAYLELFLDNGFLLGIPILIFYFLMSKHAYSLFKIKDNPVCLVTGSIGLSFLISFLIGAVGQQSFYPAIGTVGLWCAMGLIMRVHVENRGLQTKPKFSPANQATAKTWLSKLDIEPKPKRIYGLNPPTQQTK